MITFPKLGDTNIVGPDAYKELLTNVKHCGILILDKII
jgi:hypothetical protein